MPAKVSSQVTKFILVPVKAKVPQETLHFIVGLFPTEHVPAKVSSQVTKFILVPLKADSYGISFAMSHFISSTIYKNTHIHWTCKWQNAPNYRRTTVKN